MSQKDKRTIASSDPPTYEDTTSATASPLETQLWAELHRHADAGLWGVREYVEDGSRRDTTPLPNKDRNRAETLIEIIDAQPRQCWSNSQLAALLKPDWCTYVEGYVMFERYSIPIAHGWIEIDGRVAEITFEEAPDTPERTVYIGVEYDIAELRKLLLDFYHDGPLAKLKEGKRHYNSG